MQRILASTFIVLVLTLTGALCSADTGIISSNVFVRKGPSTDTPAIGSLKKGAKLSYTVDPGHNNWVRVEYNGKEGYVGRKVISHVTLSKGVNAKPLDGGLAVPAVEAPHIVNMALVAPVAGYAVGQEGLETSMPDLPVVEKTQVFEIIQDATPEELRLQAENANLFGRVKTLEVANAEIQPLKEEIVKLKTDIQTKDRLIIRYHQMFPYTDIIDSLEDNGRDVLLAGIGKARMVELGKKVVIRLENETILSGERLMKSVAKERYQTGSGETIRIYYVLNNQSIKNTN